MAYFDSCSSKQEAKSLYRKLCKKMHPDKGGDAILFSNMQKEFDGIQEGGFTSNKLEFDPIYNEAYRSFKETVDSLKRFSNDGIRRHATGMRDPFHQRNNSEDYLATIESLRSKVTFLQIRIKSLEEELQSYKT